MLRQGCEPGTGSRLPPCQSQLGTPAELPAVEAWRSSLHPSTGRRPSWRAKELFVDASGLQPKEAHVRVVGWAICGLSDGQSHSVAGWLEAGASAAAGEATATGHAVELLAPGGRIIADCLAVKNQSGGQPAVLGAAGGGHGPEPHGQFG